MPNLRIEFYLYVQTLCPNEQCRILLYNNIVICMQSRYIPQFAIYTLME